MSHFLEHINFYVKISLKLFGIIIDFRSDPDPHHWLKVGLGRIVILAIRRITDSWSF